HILVLRRFACNPRLRDALYYWAQAAARHEPAWRNRYTHLRRRGHSHARALRAIGDRLLAIACAMLRTATLYDPNRHTNKNGEDARASSPSNSQAVIGSPACTAPAA